MIRKLQTALIGVALMALAPLTASAQELHTPDATGYAGAFLGYGDPTSLNGRFAWGVDLGMIYANGLIGSIFYRSSLGTENDRETRIDHIGLGVDWSLAKMLSGPLGGFRGGVRLGASTLNASGANEPGVTDTEFSFGPSLGYDIWHLPYGLTIGGEGDLFFTMGPRQFSTLYVLADLKYWF